MGRAEPRLVKTDTKQAILQAAYAIVRNEGVDQLSASKIAQSAGISKSGFFHYFQQVDDLYLYILDDLLLTLQRSALHEKPAKLTLLINYLAESLLAVHKDNPEIFTMLLHFFSLSKQNPVYADRLHTLMLNIYSGWTDQVGGYFNGTLSDEVLDGIVQLTDIFLLGFAVHSFLLENPERYRRLAHQFGEMLENFYMSKAK